MIGPWRTRQLSQVCDFQNGFAFKSKSFRHTGEPVLRISNIQEGTIDLDKIVYINRAEYKNKDLSNYEVKPGDLLIAMSGGTTGKIGINDTDLTFLLNQRVGKFIPKMELDKRFLSYYLETMVKESLRIAAGAAQPNLSTEQIKAFLIPVPSLPEQKRIVSILDEAFAAIDKAKENAERNLANARELFDSYLNQVCNPEKKWVKTTVRALVEEGVIEKPLDGNHGEIHPIKADFVASGVPFIMASHLKGGFVDQTNCNFISRVQADTLRKGFAMNGDVLLSHKGTIGRTAILSTDHDFVVLTPQVTYYRILNKSKLLNTFLFYYFQCPTFQHQIGSIAGIGATRAYIGITKQLNLQLAYPNIIEQLSIVNKLQQVSNHRSKAVKNYQQKMYSLDELKQSILQKAFTGQLTSKSPELELVG